MPNILDVFNGDAYSCVSLTTGILKLPFKPGKLGASGLFKVTPVDTWMLALERKAGKISLIPSKSRTGKQTTTPPAERATLYPFVVPHLPHDDELLASECAPREFGTADRIESINKRLQEKGLTLRNNHEVTHEYHRIGAIQGRVLDADGTTELVDLFEKFSLTEVEVDFELDDDLTKVKLKCQEVRRRIEQKLGGRTHTGIVAQCGDGFWDSLITHPNVEKAFERANDGQFLRDSQGSGQADVERFKYGGITWENYRGKVGSVDFIPHNTARFYPTGVSDLFLEHFGPADFVETVGTMGKPFYMKQERQKYDRGIDIHTQSNPCILCSEPEVLIKGTTALRDDVMDDDDLDG